ncbi:MAG: response regulator, partial [Candidatus Omnitrophica bacterium]|nr:response regulator [Candidatus Omnitrophota bacterium]
VYSMPAGTRDILDAISGNIRENIERFTERQEQKATELKYFSLFENMNDGAAVHRILRDDKGKAYDTVFVSINAAFENQLDRNRSDVIGKKISEVLPGVEKDSAGWIQIFDEVAGTGNPRNFEAYSEALDRWYKVAVSRYDKDQIVVLFSDISEHKRVVARLRENEERFIEVFDRAQVGLIRFDRNGLLGDINNEAARILGGIDPDTIREMPADEFCGGILGIDSIFSERGLSVSGNVLIDQARLPDKEDHAVTGDRQISVDYTITRLSLGKRLLVHLKDVTERELAEEKVRQALNRLESQTIQLVEAQRFAAVGENTAALTHEINNPASNVQFLLETLLQRLQGGNVVEMDDIIRDLTRASQEIDRIAEITNRFLGFARPTMAGKMPCSVEHIMRDVYELRKGMLERMGVHVVLDFDEDVPVVLADPGRLKQAFLNTLVNALNALDSSDKREIRLSTSAVHGAGGDVAVKAAIGDTGCGIPEEELPKIWEPFYTKRKNGKGSGIGLAMVRQVAEEHNAKVDVESLTGEGTTFTFEFPAMKDPFEQLSERAGKTRVLLLRSMMHDLNNYLAAGGFVELLRSILGGNSEVEDQLDRLTRIIDPVVDLTKNTHQLIRSGDQGEDTREIKNGLDSIASDLDMIVLSARQLKDRIDYLDLGKRPLRCASNLYNGFSSARELMAIRGNIHSLMPGKIRRARESELQAAVGDMLEICGNIKNIFVTRGIDAGVMAEAVRDGERVMVKGDATALRQSVFHILTLGTDFNDTPHERVENAEYSLDIKIELNRRAGEAVVLFRNKYFRFPEEMVEEVVTEDGESLARGLRWDPEDITDLRVARQSAAVVGGRLYIENTAEGSVVRLFLPFTTEKQVGSRESKTDPSAVSQPAYLGEPERLIEGGARILVADDEPIQREMLFEVLSEQGYNVWLAGDCKQAFDMVNAASSAGAPFDLAVFDVSMPPAVDEMINDGVELTKKVREGGHTFPVFISTGHAFNDSSLADLSGEGMVTGIWQKVGGMDEKLKELKTALKAGQPSRSKATEIQTMTVDRVALVYGPDLDEGMKKLCICGFKGEIRHARDAAELEQHLKAGDIDIVVNTTDERLKDILSALGESIPVVDRITERHELRNTLLEICA